MSKVIKSHQLVEALPCRLDPIDPGAFFNIDSMDSGDENNSGAVEAAAMVLSPDEEAEMIVAEAKQQAEELVAAARKQSDDLISLAKQQGTALKEQAKLAGIEEGRKQALILVRQELADNLAIALDLLNEARVEKERRISESEPELLKLAGAICEKIIKCELQLHPEQQLGLIREALNKVAGASTIKIRVNPMDLELLQGENYAKLQEVFSEPKPIKLEGDQAIASGGCFIETEHGNVDARLKSQLDIIITELLKVARIG